jgi:hypothetical protein
VGERFYIYAAKAKARPPIWSADLQAAEPPAWMIELAEQVKLIEPELLAGAVLPTGVIVGTAVVEGVEEVLESSGVGSGGVMESLRDGVGRNRSTTPALPTQPLRHFLWHLTDVRRATRLRRPTRQPQPGWFRPF